MLLILFFQADKVLVGTMAVLGGVVAAGVAAELCARKTSQNSLALTFIFLIVFICN